MEIREYLRDAAGSRSLVFDLSITHDRFGSSTHVQQNGSLSHPQDLDTPLPAIGHGSVLQHTAHLVSCLGSLPHASERVAGQNLADPTSWNSSAPQTLKQLHDNLLTHYNCTEWAPPLADDAPAPDAPAQGHNNDSARPLSLPPINLLASLRVRQEEWPKSATFFFSATLLDPSRKNILLPALNEL